MLGPADDRPEASESNTGQGQLEQTGYRADWRQRGSARDAPAQRGPGTNGVMLSCGLIWRSTTWKKEH